MHKQVSSLLSAGGSPGKLALYTQIIADKGGNIRSIGGSEWDGTGAVAVLLDDMADEAFDELVEVLNASDFPTTTIWTAEAVLDDAVGNLAEACRAIDDMNIASILVTDSHGGKGLVTFGFESEGDAEEARSRLGDLAVPAHTLTAAWEAHEEWDDSNPNPRPDPANP
jgi:hypothetical protein